MSCDQRIPFFLVPGCVAWVWADGAECRPVQLEPRHLMHGIERLLLILIEDQYKFFPAWNACRHIPYVGMRWDADFTPGTEWEATLLSDEFSGCLCVQI